MISHHCSGNLTKNAYPQPNYEKTLLRDICQNNWPVLFRSVKDKNGIEDWGTVIDERRQEAWQLNVMCLLSCNRLRKLLKKTGWIQRKSIV